MMKGSVTVTRGKVAGETLCRYVVVAEINGKIISRQSFATRKSAERAASIARDIMNVYEMPVAQFYERLKSVGSSGVGDTTVE